MVGLVVQGDGANAVLFHVEQQKEWIYRWRIIGDYPADYLHWHEGLADSWFAILSPHVMGCRIEVEWRADSSSDWRQATLLQFARGQVDLCFESMEDMEFLGLEHTLVASRAAAGGIAAFNVHPPAGRISLLAGVPRIVTAVADAPALANWLTAPDQFVVSPMPGLTIRNLLPSVGSWLPDPGQPVLTAIPSVALRCLWTFATSTEES